MWRSVWPRRRVAFSRGKREAELAPSGKSSSQRTDAFDAALSEEQRHTGAGGFVGSSTVEDDVAVAGEQFRMVVEFAGVHVEGAGNGFGRGLEVQGMAKVHDDEVFAGVQLALQFLGRDSRDAEFTDEFAALEKFPADVADESGDYNCQQSAPKPQRRARDAFDLVGEHIAQAEKGAHPEGRAEGIEQQKPRPAHLKDSRKRRSGSVESWDEFGDQQGLGSMFFKHALRAADAGIRLERN